MLNKPGKSSKTSALKKSVKIKLNEKKQNGSFQKKENKMTLAKYIDMYIEQVKSGARQTELGRNYAPSTIKSIVTAMNQWKAFQQSVHKVYDFDDIDMKCY